MFDLGWTELLVIGVVALIVVGPKELPVLFRKVGQFVGKAKGMATPVLPMASPAGGRPGITERLAGRLDALSAPPRRATTTERRR